MPSTLYDALGVLPQAPAAVIRAAYKVLIQSVHPDRHPPEQHAWAHEETLRLNAAFDVLGNPQKRKVYDATLQADFVPDGTPAPAPPEAPSPKQSSSPPPSTRGPFHSQAPKGYSYLVSTQPAAKATPPRPPCYQHAFLNPSTETWVVEYRSQCDRLLARRLVPAGERLVLPLTEPAHSVHWATGAQPMGPGHYEARPWLSCLVTDLIEADHVEPCLQPPTSKTAPGSLVSDIGWVMRHHGPWLWAVATGAALLTYAWMSH